MALSDHGYKLLFSQPCIVSSLLRDIVPALDGGWTDILALEHMTPVRSELISNTLQRRHGDMIWRIPRKDRHDLFLVLMLEFQSRTDHAMALRLTTYRSLLYEDLLARTPLKARQTLPAVLPLVIHTGVRPWHARRDLAELIDPVPPPLTPYQPRQRYLLIDARTQAHNQSLPADSLARLIFRLEHNHGLHDTTRIIDRLGRLMQAPQYQEARRAILAWLQHVLLPRNLPDQAIPPFEDLMELNTLLRTKRYTWKEYEELKAHRLGIRRGRREGRLEGRTLGRNEGRIEGRAEGRIEGRTEGRIEGHTEGLTEGSVAILQRLLQRKFGTLPPDVVAKLGQAPIPLLGQWSERLLDAQTLEEVFD